jgi:hypothetical protein
VSTIKALPELRVHGGDLPATARALAPLLAHTDHIFMHACKPVRLVRDDKGGSLMIQTLSVDAVINEAHLLCQPKRFDRKEKAWIDATLPESVAQLYLALTPEQWGLRPLAAVVTTPIMHDDGSMVLKDYDPETKLYVTNVPPLDVPEHPSDDDAAAALLVLRRPFRTFVYADSERTEEDGQSVIDLERPIGCDETAALLNRCTAALRPSLEVAPAFLFSAPGNNGSGVGKGLAARADCMIATGDQPSIITPGDTEAELITSLNAALMTGAAYLMVDNANWMKIKSNVLAAAVTQRGVNVRRYRTHDLVPLNPIAHVVWTGNDVSVAEDCIYRIVRCEMDAKCEQPRLRKFKDGVDRFLVDIKAQRAELLSAILTIARWGRRRAEPLPAGKPFGSFETWASWIRDPLLALGARDPLDRIAVAKDDDISRAHIIEILETWFRHHGEAPMLANKLADPVKDAIDPERTRRKMEKNYRTKVLNRLANQRLAGFVFKMIEKTARCSFRKYAVEITPEATCRHCNRSGDDERGKIVACKVKSKSGADIFVPFHAACAADWRDDEPEPEVKAESTSGSNGPEPPPAEPDDMFTQPHSTVPL